MNIVELLLLCILIIGILLFVISSSDGKA